MLELELEPGDFTAFCREIHGYEPFPWQTALVDRVVKDGWPRAVTVPTGLGKTCVLDVAVFTAALERGRTGAEVRPSRAPLRIFYVVDRRLVSDEAYDHAARLARTLRSALSDPYAGRPTTPIAPRPPTVPVGTVTGRVARALWREGDTDVLEATRMRGGVTWSPNWLERPDRLAVAVGTVDQVGSRLLFRGTGTRRRSIDAALTGTDSLIVIDEAHGAEEFAAGVRAAFALDGTPEALRPVLVTMSAVAGRGSADAHGITGDDERHPVAGPRLRSAKRLYPVGVGTDAAGPDQSMAASLAAWARQLAADGEVVGVVCNTLGRARAVLELLPGEKVLLTGRSRALDREYLRGRWFDRTKAGHEPRHDGPFHVVTTQTVEVGTDLDFDALVTEAAPLPALVQRLGRLNRAGRRTDARAVVLRGTADVPLARSDASDASDATWRLLAGLCPPVVTGPGETPDLTGPGLAVSPAALRRLTAGLDATAWQEMCGSPPARTPVHAAALDAWVRTEPAPDVDEPVAPYLHGIGADARPVVSVAWRTREAGRTAEEWRDTVNLFPPAAEESIELPLHAVRRWLTGTPNAAAISDDDAFPGPGEGPSDGPPDGGSGVEVLRYRFDAATAIVTPDAIEADDLIVLPTGFGGCDAYGWNPDATDPVIDIADLGGGGDERAAVRIGPALATAVRVCDPALASRVDRLIADIAADTAPFTAEQEARYRDRFAELAGSAADDVPHLRVFGALARGGRLLTVNGLRLFVAGQAVLNGPSTAGLPQTLAEHQAEVSAAAGLYARNLHLDGPTIAAVALAAALHDEGKRDPRFQTMLHGGDEDAALAAPEPLAKSGTDPADRAGSGKARRASGYPQGMRHEALSARIAALHTAGRDDLDTDLVIHLVASHHGFARPLLPPVADPDPRLLRLTIAGQEVALGTAETVDRAGPARFEALNRRYGRWGLARLEALVRLADVYCSIQREI
ncbi:type I-G CRISPR-associated helicase/endonuclease Cas3g [Streptomyces sp. RKAG337]|uniref:type I-G CRISPR-associated helicase/endonuclease Cas3g n=1 Tax=Streptomyces sp. RKAG337 TaxID=2893404 RepID=UPI00203342C8|nr:type I-U CRISPR-associated helicase/endonuclease Cas3 [Streptomyces sp. RKAG337]MCM2430447.1 type I-U CRISPR-associated helicase/endonuclease Cas3 [Streptomyces sp. RKAG337]